MSIEGIWYNELGSSITIAIEGTVIKGVYHNEVGQATGDFDFIGTIESQPIDSNQAVAWVVSWIRKNDQKNFHSVTAWSGQYQIVQQKTERITAQWLLTSETKPDDDWASTFIGQDIFSRIKPPLETSALRAKMSGWSHPKS